MTRDTHGSAVKATYVEKSGAGINVFKDPATDKNKKSACGLLRIEHDGVKFIQHDKQSNSEEKLGQLRTVFLNGNLVYETSLEEIRQRLMSAVL